METDKTFIRTFLIWQSARAVFHSRPGKEIRGPGTHHPESILGSLRFRCIGPAVMGGSVTSPSLKKPGIIYAATASDGLWK
jgi:hypothetical protein